MVWTLRSQALTPDYSNLRRTDLIQLLDTCPLRHDASKPRSGSSPPLAISLSRGAAGAKAADDEARHRTEQLQIISGTVPASGPGIHITIQDPQGAVTPELLLDALEELRDAGAEVVEFNDSVRVVAGTWIDRDSQGRVMVDGAVLTMPIVIEAIGDPATLEAGARFRGRPRERGRGQPCAGECGDQADEQDFRGFCGLSRRARIRQTEIAWQACQSTVPR